MAGGKIDILIEPDTKNFDSKLESRLGSGVGVATKIGGAIALALGSAATVKGIADIGVEFDKQMNTMSAVSQATAAELAQVEARARELGKSSDLTATSASDAAAAMVELTKGGFTVQESMDAAKGTLQLASAAQIDAATAATIQSQALQAFGLDAEYAATASDILAGAANASSAEIEGIAQGLQQSGTVANQFGVSMEDTATALAMFANAGIQGSDAGTLLKSALLALTDQGKPAQAAIEELGLTVYDAAGEFVGLESLFGQLDQAASSMTAEQYQAATAVLFGSDAMRMAGIAAEHGAEGFDATREAVTRAGQASEVAAAQAEGMPGVLEAIENQAEDTGLAIYDAFAGLALQGGQAFVGMLETVGPQVEAFALTAAEGVQGALDMASGLSGMVGPLAGVGAALALSSWADFPARMDAGTSSISGFVAAARTQQSVAKMAGTEIGFMAASMSAMEARVPAISRAADAYRGTSVQLRAAGQQTRLTAMETTGLHQQMLLARGSAQSFGGVLAGSVSGGMSLVKSGATGLMNALGGPWALALAGAGLAIGALVQHHQEAAQAEAEHEAAQEALRDTLDVTTGKITEQTHALQMKTAQENGWLQTATDLGVAHSTVQDAMSGNAAAQREVEGAVLASTQAAVEGSDFWQTYGTRMEEAGVSAQRVAEAQAGNVDAGREISQALDEVLDKSRGAYGRMSGDIRDANGAALELNEGINGSADELAALQEQQKDNAFNELARSAENTRQVLDLLGDSIVGMPDEKTVSVEASAVTSDTKAKLEEMGALVEDPIDGLVNIVMEGGFDALQVVETLGLQLGAPFEGFITIEAASLEEAQSQADVLGLTVKEIDGNLVIDSDAPQTNADVLELIRNAQDMQGKLDIGDNVDEVEKRKDGLKLPTSSTHTVEILEQRRVSYWTQQGHSPSQAARIQGPVPVGGFTGGRFDPATGFDHLPGHATGGRHDGYRLPRTGPGTGATDGFLAVSAAGMPIARLDADEWVINGDSSETYDTLLRGVNADSPNARAALAMFQSLPGHATGRDPSESGIDRAHRLLGGTQGGPYRWGGTSMAASDCSGYVSMWQNALEDNHPIESRLGTTISLLNGQWSGLVPGTDGAFIVGVNAEHMVASLDGVNLEAGGSGMQIGAGATSPQNLAGAKMYYLPDDRIEGGIGDGRTGSRSGSTTRSAAQTERDNLEEMAAESTPRLARANRTLPPDPIVSQMMTPQVDPDGLKSLTRAGAYTGRFGAAYNLTADDGLVEFLLWAYGGQDTDHDLARAFTEQNDPTGLRSMIEAGVWTGRFGDHYNAGQSSALVTAILAARQNGGYQTIRLTELQGEMESMPGSWSELLGGVAQTAVSSAVSSVASALGHDDDFGPVMQIGALIAKRAFGVESGVDASGKILIEDSSRVPTSRVSRAEAEEIQPSGAATYDPSRGAEQWSAEITRALSITGNPSSWHSAMVQQGDIESSGNPQAVGPGSPEGSPMGVWQTKPGTYAAFRDQHLVDDVFDVLSNGVAALNYVNSVYTSLPWPTTAGYAAGGMFSPMSSASAAVVPANSFRLIGDRPRGDEFFLPDDDSSLGMGQEWARRRGFELTRAGGGQREMAAAAAPAAARPINVTTNGFDRRDLVEGIRQARGIERWEAGF